MKPRTTTCLALALLLAAGLGVSAGSASAQTAKKKRTTHSATAHGKSTAHKSGRRSGKRSSRARGQKAPAPERISEIQEALARDGSYTGTPNGKWDDQTVAAMKKYQQAHGLNPSGKLDAHTLQQLGLGSQTAGVAAPMPPVSSSSILTPSRSTAQRR